MGDPPDIVIRPELFWKHRLRHSARKLQSHMHLSCLEESTVVSFRLVTLTARHRCIIIARPTYTHPMC